MDDEEKLQYIQEFEEIEGILLDYEEIKKNMAKRSIAKLMFNSVWGFCCTIIIRLFPLFF
jgi:hypothetical protein